MDQLDAEICISEGNFEEAKAIIQQYPLPMEEELLRLAKLTAQRVGDDSWTEFVKARVEKTASPRSVDRHSCPALNRLLLADRRRAEAWFPVNQPSPPPNNSDTCMSCVPKSLGSRPPMP